MQFTVHGDGVVSPISTRPPQNVSEILLNIGCRTLSGNLLNAARKAFAHGYKVYILPNPYIIRTPDFIFEKKGTFRPYELKTISGKSSVSHRLEVSYGQSVRVLLNLTVDYNQSNLARCIKHYFEHSRNALEVLIFKGKKSISVSREMAQSKSFFSLFLKKYSK